VFLLGTWAIFIFCDSSVVCMFYRMYGTFAIFTYLFRFSLYIYIYFVYESGFGFSYALLVGPYQLL